MNAEVDVPIRMEQLNSRQQGFTLIEIVIALIITAFLTLGSYQLISNVSITQQFSRESFKAQEREFRIQNLIFQDFIHMVPRSIRDELGATEQAFLLDTDEYSVVFTRSGMPILGDNTSSLLRLAYSLENDILLRWHWSHLDRPNGEEPVKQELLTGVEDFKVEVWNRAQQKFIVNKIRSNVLPEMLKVTLVLENGVELEQIIPGLGT